MHCQQAGGEQMEETAKTDNLDRLFTTLDNVADEPKEYIYSPYIPRGKVTGIAGDPGVGKTKFALGVAARVTAGEPLLGVTCEAPGNVLVFSTEDDAADIKQTVASCGGNLDKVHVLSEQDEALELLKNAALTFGHPLVESAVKRYTPVMVLFDPLQIYLGPKVNPNDGVAASAAIKPLLSLAKRYNFAAVVIMHNNKMTDASLQNRAAGSASIVGCYRSLLSVVRDPEREEEDIAIHTKTNNRRGKAIRYKISSIKDNENFATVDFLQLENYTERDYQAAIKRKTKAAHASEISDSDIVVATIIRLLEDNPGELKISRYDLQDSASAYFSEPITQGLADIEKEYAAYLLSRHGIFIQCRPAQDLRPFIVKGRPARLLKTHDRCLLIRKKNIAVQVEL